MGGVDVEVGVDSEDGVDVSVLMGGDDMSVGVDILFVDLIGDLVLDLVRLTVAAGAGAGDGRSVGARRKVIHRRLLFSAQLAREKFFLM